MNKIDVLDKGYVRLVDHMGNDLSIVNAARVSYDKESESMSERDQSLLTYLLKHEHTSPLRHAAVTLEIYAPLLVARQWWKYAVSSTHIDDQNGWNESSRRYITENEQFHIPTVWRSFPENSKQGSGDNLSDNVCNMMTQQLLEHVEKSEKLYNLAMLNNVAPEQARLFLPAYAMYVRWRWTISLAGMLNFLQQRIAHDAQREIQAYAQATFKLVSPLYPETFKASGISL